MSIDLVGVEQFRTAQPFDPRRRDRRACDLRAVICTRDGELSARILNISGEGIGFAIDPLLGLKPGDGITLRQETMGEVRCIVRWTLHPRYGAEFEPPGKTPPGVRDIYDSIPGGHGDARQDDTPNSTPQPTKDWQHGP